MKLTNARSASSSETIDIRELSSETDSMIDLKKIKTAINNIKMRANFVQVDRICWHIGPDLDIQCTR